MESILLVGKDEAALRRLKGYLVKRGFRVTALDPDELRRGPDPKERFVLSVLDAEEGRPLSDEIAQVRSKSAYEEIPLVVLLKEKQIRELNSAAGAGVEDFLVSPVEPELLEARIRFVLKRLNHLAPGTGIRIGSLVLDPDRYEVTLDGEPLELTYKEFELFKFLATHPGKVYSRDQLLNQVWGYDFIGGTRTVDVHIRRLRAKLGPKYASLIDTVRNVGYKFLESL